MIKIRFVFTVLVFFIKLQNFTLHRIHFNTFCFGGEGTGGAFIRGSIHLEGAFIRGLFFCSEL